MKKVLAVLILIAIMISGLGNGIQNSNANGYTDVPSALPAEPVPTG